MEKKGLGRGVGKLLSKIIVIAIALIMVGLATPSAIGKVVLKVNSHMAPVSPPGRALEAWKTWVESESGGQVEVRLFHGGALLRADQAFKGVQKGIADIAIYVTDKSDGFHLNRVINLPFLPYKSIEQAERVYEQLLREFPALIREWEEKGVVPLGFYWFRPVHLHMRDKVVRAPEDIKGIRIFSAEDVIVTSFRRIGASMVEMDIGDLYTSLERGLVEGFVNQFPTLGAFGVTDLLKTHIIFGEGTGIFVFGFHLIMNKQKYESLPNEVKSLLQKSVAVFRDEAIKGTKAQEESVINHCKQNKHIFVTLTAEEIARWRDAVMPSHEQWVNEVRGREGLAREIYKRTLKLCAQVE